MVNKRWNTEFSMLERLVKLKYYVKTVIHELDIKPALARSDFIKIKKILLVAEPLYTATTLASGIDYPTLSMVIPLTEVMKSKLVIEKNKHLEDSIPYVLADKLIQNIEARFPELQFSLSQRATYLDPRYKSFFFSNEQLQTTEESLLSEIINGENGSIQGMQANRLKSGLSNRSSIYSSLSQ